MKNKIFKIALSVFSLVMLISMVFPHLAAASPALAHAANHLPTWLNHVLGMAGSGATVAQFLPTPGQPIAPLNKPAPAITTVAAANGANITKGYSTGGGAKNFVRITQDRVGQLSFIATYTVGGTYVANTDIPIIPRTATDALPTGITFGSNNFTNFAAFTNFYASGLKFAIFGAMVFNVSAQGLLQNGAIHVKQYNDANITSSDIATPFSQAAPNWTNNFNLLEQFIGDSNWVSGDLNNQILMQLPATTGVMTMTYYVKATTQSHDFAQAIQ